MSLARKIKAIIDNPKTNNREAVKLVKNELATIDSGLAQVEEAMERGDLRMEDLAWEGELDETGEDDGTT